MSEETLPKNFSYCVGKPWHPKDPESAICVYAFGSTVFHGTLEEAIRTRDFVDSRDKGAVPRKIYRLVEIEISEK